MALTRKYVEKILRVSEINLDQENPRFPPVGNQREAIQEMLRSQGVKIAVLAEDIYKNGMNPSSKLIVFKENGRFVDGDGNRRLTALKILETPSLSDGYPAIRRRVDSILKGIGDVPTELSCVVFESREDSNHWISINHNGPQDGRGQIPWDSEQKERFEGTHSIGLQALDLLERAGKINAEDRARVKKTTLDRLLSYKEVKKVLAIKKVGPDFDFRKLFDLQKVVLALRNLKVDEVYTAEKGIDFVSRVVRKEELANPEKGNSKADIRLEDYAGEDDSSGDDRILDLGGSTTKEPQPSRSRRKKGLNAPVFGGALYLKSGHVNNLYRDVEKLYEIYKQGRSGFSDDFIVIFRMSLRMLAETAGREIGLTLEQFLLNHFDAAKASLDKDGKTLLSSQSVERRKVVSLFHTGAHDYTSSRNESQAVALSIILGAILKLTHGKNA